MAVIRWIGNATPVKQIDTITIALVWAAADTITVTISSKSMTLTVSAGAGGAPTTDEVATMLAAALNAGSATADIQFSETRDIGGQEIPEFKDFVATVVGSVVYLTGRKAGKPFTVTSATEVTAGTGTATLAHPTAATGPNFLDNADNWEGGAVPGDQDTARFDQGNVDVLYNLHDWADDSREVSFVRTMDYEGMIGLPEFDPDYGFWNYRDRYLEIYWDADDITVDFLPGDAGGKGGTTRLDMGAYPIARLNVQEANRVGSGDVVELAGGAPVLLSIGRGYVVIDPANSPGANTMDPAAVVVGAYDIRDRDCKVIFGADVLAAANNTGWTVLSGQVRMLGGTKAGTAGTIDGGEVEIDSATATATTLYVKNGTYYHNTAGTIANVYNNPGGTVDFSRAARTPAAITNLYMSAGSTLNKAGRTQSYTLSNCKLQDVTITE